jgi:hypothetical protein
MSGHPSRPPRAGHYIHKAFRIHVRVQTSAHLNFGSYVKLQMGQDVARLPRLLHDTLQKLLRHIGFQQPITVLRKTGRVPHLFVQRAGRGGSIRCAIS